MEADHASKVRAIGALLVLAAVVASAQSGDDAATRNNTFEVLRARLTGTRWAIAWGAAGKAAEDNTLISVDPTRYRTRSDGFRAFVRLDHSVAQLSPLGTAYNQTVVYEDLDCAGERLRLLDLIDYNYPSGEPIYTEHPDTPKWVVAMPDTRNEVVLNAVCNTLRSLTATTNGRSKKKSH